MRKQYDDHQMILSKQNIYKLESAYCELKLWPNLAWNLWSLNLKFDRNATCFS